MGQKQHISFSFTGQVAWTACCCHCLEAESNEFNLRVSCSLKHDERRAKRNLASALTGWIEILGWNVNGIDIFLFPRPSDTDGRPPWTSVSLSCMQKNILNTALQGDGIINKCTNASGKHDRESCLRKEAATQAICSLRAVNRDRRVSHLNK